MQFISSANIYMRKYGNLYAFKQEKKAYLSLSLTFCIKLIWNHLFLIQFQKENKKRNENLNMLIFLSWSLNFLSFARKQRFLLLLQIICKHEIATFIFFLLLKSITSSTFSSYVYVCIWIERKNASKYLKWNTKNNNIFNVIKHIVYIFKVYYYRAVQQQNLKQITTTIKTYSIITWLCNLCIVQSQVKLSKDHFFFILKS